MLRKKSKKQQMSPVLDQIQEKVYERPIPYSPVLGHSGSNQELLVFNYLKQCLFLVFV